MLAHRRGGGGLDLQLELGGEPGRAQGPQRVVRERLGAHHPQPPRLQVGAPAVRVEQLAAAERLRHRVDGEVARGEVGGEVVVAQADEVDVPGVAARDHAPGAECAGQHERGAGARAGHRARGRLRVAGEGDVEIGGVAAEQPVAHRAADDPGLRLADARACGLERVAHAAGS